MTESDRNHENLAWLRQKVQAETERIELPPSLTSQSLLHLLDDVEQEEGPLPEEPAKVIRPRWGQWKPWAAAAAVALIAATAFHQFGGNLGGNGILVESSSSTASVANSEEDSGVAGISYASDYGEVRQLLASQDAWRTEFRSGGEFPELGETSAPLLGAAAGGANDEAAPEIAEESSPQQKPAPESGSKEATKQESAPQSPMMDSASFTGTNQQVAEVEEADIVKTDGSSLFIHINEDASPEVVIVDASSMKKLSTITLEPSYGSSELYLCDETLVVMQTEAPRTLPFQKGISEAMASDKDAYPQAEGEGTYSFTEDSAPSVASKGLDWEEMVVSAVVYDVSDKEQPKEIRRFEQDGSYVSSRVSDGTLYLISQKYVWQDPSDENVPLDELVPVTGDSLAKGSRPLEAQSIVYCPEGLDQTYTVVSAVNLSDATEPANTKAVLGYADEVYMTTDNIYLSGSRDGQSTNLMRVAVDGSDLRFAAIGSIPGKLLNQFSMDEEDGYFRVASTSLSDGKTVNNLYVLDSSLKQVGSVEGLARGEAIRSVRYMGDIAYVVTFRQVDPLFVLDLSTPSQPKLLGQLKIPGFSEYLHPVDSSTLIGFGTNTVVTESGTVLENGMKLSLFDVSDPLNPKESHVFYLGNRGSYSEGKENHKAFLYDGQRSQIGFPATIATQVDKDKGDAWSNHNEVTFSGYLLLNFSKEDGFEIAASLPTGGEGNGVSALTSGESIRRGVRIGQSFYTVSNETLIRYSMDGYQESGRVAL